MYQGHELQTSDSGLSREHTGEKSTKNTTFAESSKPLKGNSGIFKPRPYFWHEMRSSTHREQFGESRRPSEDI